MTVVPRRNVRKYVVLPASLLVLNAIEELLVYKSVLIRSEPLRVTMLLVLFAFGIGLVSFVVSPVVERALTRIHRNTKRGWGFAGELVLLGLLVAGLYQLYAMVYVDGAHTMLPISWRN